MIKRPNTFLHKFLYSSDPLFFRSPTKAFACLVSGSAFLGGLSYFYSEYAGSEIFSSFSAAKRDGVTVHPSPKIHHLMEKAMTELKFSDSEKSSVRLFSVASKECEALGSVKTFAGASLGIPAFLNAESVEEVHLEDLTDPVIAKEKWNIVPQLEEKSVLSDNAKLYVIADGLLRVRNSHEIILDLASICCVVGGLLQAATIVKFSKFKFKPHVFRVPVYAFSLTLWVALFLLFEKSLKRNCCEDHCKLMSDLGESYIDGGIEYFEKLIECNKLINLLHPGSSTESGDQQSSLEFYYSEILSLLKEKKITSAENK